MKFGIFDHLDRRDAPIHELYRDRLSYAEACDKAGFYGYHIAEHHQTPLNMVPVPSVYLGAVARETKRIRLGALTYLLPLYSPLCLIEELAILDHQQIIWVKPTPVFGRVYWHFRHEPAMMG